MNIDYPQLYMLLLMMIHPIPKYRPSVIDMNKNLSILLKSYSSKISFEKEFDEQLSRELTTSFSN